MLLDLIESSYIFCSMIFYDVKDCLGVLTNPKLVSALVSLLLSLKNFLFLTAPLVLVLGCPLILLEANKIMTLK